MHASRENIRRSGGSKVQPQGNPHGHLGDDDATQVIKRLGTGGDDPSGAAPQVFQMQSTHRLPNEWRAVFVLAGVVVAHVLLGLAQPNHADSVAFQWSIVAFAATIGCGLVAIFIEKAEGIRKVMLTLQLGCALIVVILDSLYWVRLVLN